MVVIEKNLGAGYFPLEQWFDVTQHISKADADDAEAQMALYAHKEGMPLHEARQAYLQMRRAVKAHNQSLKERKQK